MKNLHVKIAAFVGWNKLPLALLVGICFFVSTSLFAQDDSLVVVPDTCKQVQRSWPLPDFSWVDSTIISVTYFSGVYCEDPACMAYVVTHCAASDFCFMVYDRWGEVLFESYTPGEGWRPFGYAEGTYLWTLNGTYETGESFKFWGKVDLWYAPEIYPELEKKRRTLDAQHILSGAKCI